jgi:hypothetical protein
MEMAKHEVPVADGKITVIVQDKYDVYEKPLPEGLDTNVNWLGNFGISEKATGKKFDGKVPKYEIEVLDEAGKKLYYWTGTEKKEVPGQQIITKKNKKFRKGELDLGDPAVGWDR